MAKPAAGIQEQSGTMTTCETKAQGGTSVGLPKAK